MVLPKEAEHVRHGKEGGYKHLASAVRLHVKQSVLIPMGLPLARVTRQLAGRRVGAIGKEVTNCINILRP